MNQRVQGAHVWVPIQRVWTSRVLDQPYQMSAATLCPTHDHVRVLAHFNSSQAIVTMCGVFKLTDSYTFSTLVGFWHLSLLAT